MIQKNKKKILRIFIAGHNGMVGRSLVKFLKKKKFGNLILASRKNLIWKTLTKSRDL